MIVTSSPTTKTSVGHPRSRPPIPSPTGTGELAASGTRRTKPASTKPMKAMNRPMPTAMAFLRAMGTASNTDWRTPVSTRTVIASPSRTTMPMAAGHDICPASWKATTPFSPRPAATASGYRPMTPIRIVMTAATRAVELATWPMSRRRPSMSAAPARMIGLSTTM